MNPLRSLTLY